MKPFIFVLLFFSTFLQAQDVEDMQEGSSVSETAAALFHADVRKPFDYYLLNTCAETSQFVRAQYQGGDSALATQLLKNVYFYVDRELYAVNGPFYLNVNISKEGKVTAVDSTPKVKNSAPFLKSLNAAFLNVPQRWTPSICDGVPVDSKIRIQLNFATQVADI